MKKLILVAATAALIAGCGKKDAEEVKTDSETVVAEVTETVETKTEEVVEAATSGLSADARKAMMESCEEEGQTAEACGCTIKVMEDGLSEETLALIAKAAMMDDDAASEKFMQDNMTEAQGMEFFGIMPGLMECDPNFMENMTSE